MREVDELVAAANDSMVTARVRCEASMFGFDRQGMSTFEIMPMKIYLRELRRMTPEEIESALVGFHADWWERLTDVQVIRSDPSLPAGTIIMSSLESWLP